MDVAAVPELSGAAGNGLKKVPSVSPCSTMEALPGESFAATASAAMKKASVAPPPPTREASGRNHSLRLAEDGSVLVSGGSTLEEEGEVFIAHLGLGEEWGEPVTTPAVMCAPAQLQAPLEVAAGDLHSLILCKDGTVWSCGAGWEGPLGHRDGAPACVPRCIAALSAVRVVSVAAGGAHSLAVSEGGALWSWGWGRYGQLGHGGCASEFAPRRVLAVDSLCAVQAAAGVAHSLVLTAHGQVYAFGRGCRGQCGQSGDSDLLLPKPVDALASVGVALVGAVGDSSVAVTADDSRYVWGDVDGAPCRSPVLA